MRVFLLAVLTGLFPAIDPGTPAFAATKGEEEIKLPSGRSPSGPSLPSGIATDDDDGKGTDDPAKKGSGGDGAAPDGGSDKEDAVKPAVLPEIHYGSKGLPKPVARLREQLLEAARSGDVNRLKPIFEANEGPPIVSFGEDTDPIAHIKKASGDKEGREVLAIMIEILEAGWLRVDKGTDEEMYIWPYFARYPLDSLTPAQKVELFKIVTAGDFQDMQEYGVYNFYRLGIGPDGRWNYFVAGD